MSDSQKYTPLSERLQQDVWHDNFVPKYSALATAEPSRLVLVGVWLIFAPMALGALFALFTVADSPDLATAVISAIGAVLFFLLAIAILYTQTRRYFAAAWQRDSERDHDNDSDQAPDDGVTTR